MYAAASLAATQEKDSHKSQSDKRTHCEETLRRLLPVTNDGIPIQLLPSAASWVVGHFQKDKKTRLNNEGNLLWHQK